MYRQFEALLNARGITAYKVAKDTGIGRSTFSQWKNGVYEPKLDKLQILANYFDVPVGFFYEDVSDIENEMRRAADALVQELSIAEDLQRVLSRDDALKNVKFTDDQLNQIIEFARFIVR